MYDLSFVVARDILIVVGIVACPLVGIGVGIGWLVFG